MQYIKVLLTGILLQGVLCFGQQSETIYKNAELADYGLDREVFLMAYQGYTQIDSARKGKLAIIDYSRPSVKKRFFLVNLQQPALQLHTHVAHGKNTGANKAKRFSNKPGSKQSSLGFFLTGETYQGKHGYSLKLKGLEPGVNDNARKRYIVIHGAWYVSQNMIEQYGRLGRSWGCPAFAKDKAQKVIDMIKNGVCLFIYGSGYREKSVLLRQ